MIGEIPNPRLLSLLRSQGVLTSNVFKNLLLEKVLQFEIAKIKGKVYRLTDMGLGETPHLVCFIPKRRCFLVEIISCKEIPPTRIGDVLPKSEELPHFTGNKIYTVRNGEDIEKMLSGK